MKNLIKLAVGAMAVCAVATASAGVIIQSSTAVNKKKVTVVYQQNSAGVLQSMTIKQKKLAKWCHKNGGCSNAVRGADSIIVAQASVSVDESGSQAVAVPEPATLALLGAGLLGMGLAARRRKSLAA